MLGEKVDPRVQRFFLLTGQKHLCCVVDATQREQLDRPVRDRAALRLRQDGKDRYFLQQRFRDKGVVVTVVIEDAQRGRRADRVAVQVREHLLAAFQPPVQEEN